MLDSADTKYDALITNIWALNNFAALFSNAVGVADWAAQRPVFGAACAVRTALAMWRHTQGSKKLTKFRPSRPKCPLTADPYIPTPHEHPHILYISRNNIHRPIPRGAFRAFKGIQGHWSWCQLKAHTQFPISPYYTVPLVLSCTVSDLQHVLCAPDPTPIQP